MMKRSLSFSLLVVLIIILSACGGSSEPEEAPTVAPITPPPSATPIPTITPFPTSTPFPTDTPIPTKTPTPDLTATAVAESTITLDQTISFQGVSFDYSDRLFTVLDAESISPLRNIQNPGAENQELLEGVPNAIVFEGGVDEPTSRPPLLIVQPILDSNNFYFEAYSEDEKILFDTLRRNVNTRPNPSILFSPTDYVIQSTYVEFEGGSGVSNLRFLTASEEAEEFTNQQLFYVFEGVSEDGRYFVYFQYPVTVEVLPDEPTFSQAQLNILAENEDNYIIYLMNEMDQVGRVTEEELTPSRELLDSIVSSITFGLNIGPDAVAAVDIGASDNRDDEDVVEDPDGDDSQQSEVEVTGTPMQVAEVPVETVQAAETAAANDIVVPTDEPTETPEPTDEPTTVPTETAQPTDEATNTPTSTPTAAPTETPQPTDQPTNTPTPVPTETPQPTDQPTNTPTPVPTETPQPTDQPTNTPTPVPTETPQPTDQPTNTPTNTPTPAPTETPQPTGEPTNTPTSTPTPTAAATATRTSTNAGPVPTYDPSCSHFMVFVDDITIPDGTVIQPGETFEKTWRVVNRGTCPLSPLFEMISFSSNPIPVESIEEIPIILPGEEGNLSVTFRGPEASGQYTSNWQVRAPDGFVFGQLFTIIQVP